MTPQVLAELVDLRHDLHAHPEIGFELPRTSKLVADRLRGMGLDPRVGVGVTAVIPSTNDGPTIALRADMDALPILEQNGFEYASRSLGAMHACGHDGHTTILLGAAKVLCEQPELLPGPVKLLFQPAEEIVAGAAAMIRDGALENPQAEAIFGLHGWPGIPLGSIGIREGAMMASSDSFDAVIKGKGAHAAHPDGGVDPIAIAAHIITAWQTAVTRRFPATNPVVVTVTKFEAGTAYNIIPQEATISGTFRTLSSEIRERVPDLLLEVANGICGGFGAEFEFSLVRGTEVTVNDPRLAQYVAQIAGEERVRWIQAPSMGAEDFGQFAQVVPGCFFWLGLGDRPFCHSPDFDFADEAIEIGVQMFVDIARGYTPLTR